MNICFSKLWYLGNKRRIITCALSNSTTKPFYRYELWPRGEIALTGSYTNSRAGCTKRHLPLVSYITSLAIHVTVATALVSKVRSADQFSQNIQLNCEARSGTTYVLVCICLFTIVFTICMISGSLGPARFSGVIVSPTFVCFDSRAKIQLIFCGSW